MTLNSQFLKPSRWKEARHLLINHLPPFTANRDVKYALQRSKVPGILNVSPMYNRFRPTDSALIALSTPNHVSEAMVLLRRFNIAGFDLHAQPVIPPFEWDFIVASKKRKRGHQGRKEACARGIMDGMGPWAGLGGEKMAEKAVVLTGFPGTTSVETVGELLEGYEVALSKEERMIYKVPIPDEANTLYSKFLVIMKSQEDALKVYRELHQTPLQTRKQHVVQAQLIY